MWSLMASPRWLGQFASVAYTSQIPIRVTQVTLQKRNSSQLYPQHDYVSYYRLCSEKHPKMDGTQTTVLQWFQPQFTDILFSRTTSTAPTLSLRPQYPVWCLRMPLPRPPTRPPHRPLRRRRQLTMAPFIPKIRTVRIVCTHLIAFVPTMFVFLFNFSLSSTHTHTPTAHQEHMQMNTHHRSKAKDFSSRLPTRIQYHSGLPAPAFVCPAHSRSTRLPVTSRFDWHCQIYFMHLIYNYPSSIPVCADCLCIHIFMIILFYWHIFGLIRFPVMETYLDGRTDGNHTTTHNNQQHQHQLRDNNRLHAHPQKPLPYHHQQQHQQTSASIGRNMNAHTNKPMRYGQNIKFSQG